MDGFAFGLGSIVRLNEVAPRTATHLKSILYYRKLVQCVMRSNE